MRPIEIFQGADVTLVVETNDDLSSATEIEFYIDTPTQIKKTLSAAEISSVTTTQFSVAIDAADTASQAKGSYKMQARATVGGKKRQGRFTPNKIKLRESVFETQNWRIKDYGE
jgi:hypothetical protein